MEARISSAMKLLKFKQLGEYMSQVHIKDEKRMKNGKKKKEREIASGLFIPCTLKDICLRSMHPVCRKKTTFTVFGPCAREKVHAPHTSAL
jgi:hypothetical protein